MMRMNFRTQGLRALMLAGIILATGGFARANVLITEVADPANEFGARFVELYNASATPVDLTGWELRRYSNGGTSPTSIALSGSIPGGGFYIIANSADYDAQFGSSPDITNSVISGNGDDVYDLFNGSSVVDVFGEVGVDGTGEAWEYLDGRAERNNGVTAGNGGTFAVGEWTVTNGGVNAPGGFDPGSWIGELSFGGSDDYTILSATSFNQINVDQAGGPFTVSVELEATTATINIDSANLTGSGLWTAAGANPTAIVLGTTDTLDFTYTPTVNDGAVATATVQVVTSGNSPTSFTVSLTGSTLFDTDIATARAAYESGVSGTTVYRVTGTVGANNILSSSGNQFSIQDRTDGDAATRGIVVSDFGGTGLDGRTLPAVGDEVTVTGTLADFNSLVQIAPTTAYTTATGTVPTPVVVDLSDLGDATEGVLLRINGIAIPAGTYTPSTNISGITDGSGAVDRVIRLDDDFPGDFTAQAPGESFYDVIGLGGQFDFSDLISGGDGYQILPRSGLGGDILENSVPVELSGFSVE